MTILSAIMSGIMSPIMTDIMGVGEVPFALIWKGAPPDYTTYTRLGEGWSVGISGDPIATAEDDPMFEWINGVKYYLNYAGTNIIPNSEDPSSWTIESGVIYDPITMQFTIPPGESVTFLDNTSSGYENKNYISRIKCELISGDGIVRLNDGVGSTDGAFTVSKNVIVARLTDASATRLRVQVRNEISPTVDCVVKLAEPQIEENTYLIPYIPTTGTAVTVNQPALKLRAEDNGPDLAVKPWSATTLDVPSQIVKYGLEGLYNGVGSGVQIIRPLDTDWVVQTNAVVLSSIITFSLSANQGTVSQLSSSEFISGDTIEITYKITSNIGTLRLFLASDGFSAAQELDASLGEHTERALCTITGGEVKLIVLTNTGTLIVESLSYRKVQPAIGRTIFEGFNTRSIATDIDLILSDTGTRYLWIEATTGLIKTTDGTNTAVSSSAIVIDTEYDFYISHYIDSMHITLGGVKGDVAPFVGTFPAIGEFLKYTDSPVYHTVENSYFEDVPSFEYVYHEGELVTHNGEAVIVYT